jgi:hypothetical protein
MEHTALIYTMVLISAANREMSDSELYSIGEIVRTLPAFEGFEVDNLPKTAKNCATMLGGKDGLDAVVRLIRDSLPDRLRETGNQHTVIAPEAVVRFLWMLFDKDSSLSGPVRAGY